MLSSPPILWLGGRDVGSGSAFFFFSAYVVVINMAGFLAFAWDKHCARNGLWRVPERTLLSIAAVGGTIGALVANEPCVTKRARSRSGRICF
ncbi:DUF1294 domain-containing protein (plasmid) [Mesorhizobium sp. AaZ16]|uniref:DUF1294 domain-containing protein n=1 Tax=Mesorhizobium sp. AaZ16 TaxID=3402289 RepID=UPI00374E8C33